jgi:hypothetical protein
MKLFSVFFVVSKIFFIFAASKSKSLVMTEINKKYRLTSTEEPTDEMLNELMTDVLKAARESSAKAEAEKKCRLQAVAKEVAEWKRKIAV